MDSTLTTTYSIANNIGYKSFVFRYTSQAILTSNVSNKYSLYSVLEKIISDDNISVVFPKSLIEQPLTTYNIDNLDWISALNSVYVDINGTSNLITSVPYSIKWMKNIYLSDKVQVMPSVVFKYKNNAGLFNFETVDIALQLRQILNNYIV